MIWRPTSGITSASPATAARVLVLIEPSLCTNLTNARILQRRLHHRHFPGQPARWRPGAQMDWFATFIIHRGTYGLRPRLGDGAHPGHAARRCRTPIEFFYKSDVEALLTRCLIKAIEARTFVIAAPRPRKPTVVHARADEEPYDTAMIAYNSETALERLRLVDSDERQGWTLTGYFYRTLGLMEKDGSGLRDEIAPMIYGMDVGGEEQHARQLIFVKEVPSRPVASVAANPDPRGHGPCRARPDEGRCRRRGHSG